MEKAPGGYKPFYISHYGRHGSRYAWNPDEYTYLHKVFSQAHEAGVLTEAGEEFYTKYEDFYLLPYINAGDLVPLGYEQHKRLGEWVYDSFPRVFRGRKKVDAMSSTGQRCIVSMSSFCLSLAKRNPGLEFYQSATHSGMTVIAPPSAPAQLRRSFTGRDVSQVESVSHFNQRTIDYEGILSRLFTDVDFVKNYPGGRTSFCNNLFSFLNGYHNYSEEPIFDGTLTDSQMLTLWEASNYSSYFTDLTARYNMIPLLEDIISKSQAAFSDPSKAADLRFGHDYVVEAFLCLIDADGCGTLSEKASQAKDWYQNYNIPMATTVLFVFYKNRKGDILFRLVWNEEDATLPQLTPVKGCFYRWDDFLSWANALMAAHPEING